MLKRSASSVFWWSVLLGLPLYFWIWSIGTQLRPKKEKFNSLSQILFRLSIIFPVVYCVFGIVLILKSGDVIKPLHFSAMLSSLYALIVAAKTLKSAELNRKAKVSEFLGDFFLLWFFPIGVWILQPRINKLVNKKQ